MRPSLGHVLDTLKAEGLATDAADTPARAALRAAMADELPWYLRLAIGLGAWMATGFLLGFLLAVAGLDDPILRMGAGIGVIVAGLWWHPRAPSEFVKHAAVAACLAGQGLLLTGVYEWTDSPRVAAAIAAAAGVVLVRLMPDGVHRFLTTIAIVVASFVLLADERSPLRFEVATVALVAAVALVWRVAPRRMPGHEEMFRPVGLALVVTLFAALLVGASSQLGRLSFDSGGWLVAGRVTTVGLAVALLLLARAILEEQESRGRAGAFAAYTAIVVLALTTLGTPGIVAGAGVLTLAFDRRDRVLLGMGIVFLLLFGAVYYYNMNLTLLEKAGVLAGSGLLLLAVRHRLVRT